MGLTDTVLEIIREDPAGDPLADPLYIPDMGMILGGRHLGMSRLQVADLFQVELGPTPFPRGGFYGQKDLHGPYFLADQIIGPVDFSGSAR